jgi:lipopolysaccharide biosynthesis regulator YciM
MQWLYLLFLLLPLAAASGWWAARRSGSSHQDPGERPAPAFFRGLNYLLNEQPDKAIDVFLRLAEVDSETVETHLALGSLFRRRGEVDRAIRVHQNLVARTNLSTQQRGYALYELGRDYMCAGLFDRAEGLFKELTELKVQQRRALRGLIEIYQQEKDWSRCLETAEQLQRISGEPMAIEIAQYHCEMAEEGLRDGNTAQARAHLLDAQAVDRNCIRATMLQARMELAGDQPATAAMLYRLVAERGPRFVPAMLPGLLECWRRMGRTEVAADLEQLFRAYPTPPLMLELAAAIERERGTDAAMAFLVDYLDGHADLAGAERLLAMRVEATESTPFGDPTLLAVVRHLLAAEPVYQCDHCGFEARDLHWQCPSCKWWGSIKAREPDAIGAAAQASPQQSD